LNPSEVIGVSTITGRPVTLAEAVAAAGARVAADRILGDETPDVIVHLSQIKL
jgi:hypothetical protein